MKQAIGSCSPRLTRRIETDPSLTHPDQKAADPRCECNRRMGDTGARLQHQASESSNGDVRPHAVPVHDDEGAVQDIEPPLLDE